MQKKYIYGEKKTHWKDIYPKVNCGYFWMAKS